MVNVADRDDRGFTLIELLVALAILATLLAVAAPRYLTSLDASKEAILRENLTVMRDAIDKHYTDTGAYPLALTDLTARKYLRRIPIDPFTGSATTWVAVPPEGGPGNAIYDVRSASTGVGKDGTRHDAW
jgi:general secretion pathway protein G